MAEWTVPLAATAFDLAGARATLRTWLQAHGTGEGDSCLDLSTAQVSLRAVHEELLGGWALAQEAKEPVNGHRLLLGAHLVRLSEAALWSALSADDGKGAVPDHVRDTVSGALRLLDGVATMQGSRQSAEAAHPGATA